MKTLQSSWLARAACAVVVCVALVSVVSATPIEWVVSDGGNGHYYDVVVVGSITWDQAKTHAEAQVYMGYAGHLATITSSAENAWLGYVFPDLRKTWIGAYQDHSVPDYSEPSGGWRWVTGEPWEYTNWAQQHGEPNDAWPEGEDHVEIWAWGGLWWNDYDGHDGMPQKYLVEYDVPEPVTLAMLFLGGLALLRRRRG